MKLLSLLVLNNKLKYYGEVNLLITNSNSYFII